MPKTATTGAAPAEEQAARIRQASDALEAKAEAKRIERNAKARAKRVAAKQAPPSTPASTPSTPQPPVPAVVQYGNYKLQTATGRLKYGAVEITEDLEAASIHVTPATLRRLPASPNVVSRGGKLHLTEKSLREFVRVLS